MPDARSQDLIATDLARAGALIAEAGSIVATCRERLGDAKPTHAGGCSNVTDHRASHRPGPAPKIASDPELEAFIRARISSMTFTEIADAVAAQFPPERQVKKSAIHKWWREQDQP